LEKVHAQFHFADPRTYLGVKLRKPQLL